MPRVNIKKALDQFAERLLNALKVNTGLQWLPLTSFGRSYC